MKQDAVVEAVLRHPKYQELLRRRGRTSMFFFILTLVLYAGFILTLAFNPVWFGSPIAPGYTMSIGVLTASLLSVAAVVLVALYVWISNRVFDPLLAAIVKDVT